MVEKSSELQLFAFAASEGSVKCLTTANVEPVIFVESAEERVLAYAAHSGSMAFLLTQNIEPNFFDVLRAEADFLYEAYSRNGTIPTITVLGEKFSDRRWERLVPDERDVPVYVEKVRSAHVRRKMAEYITQMGSLYKDPERWTEIVTDLSREMHTELSAILEPNQIVDIAGSGAEARYDSYREKAKRLAEGESVGIPMAHPRMNEYLGGYQRGKLYMPFSRPKKGTCVAGHVPVLTPRGPVPIRDIQEGDVVYGYNDDGSVSPSRVLAKFDNGLKEVVDITYRRRVIASATPEHRWLTTHPSKGKAERTTAWFSNSDTRIVRRLVEIPCGEVFEPHAYSIGALLGDGCSMQWSSHAIVMSSPDEWVPVKVADVLGTPWKKMHKSNYTYKISHVPRGVHGEYNWRDYPPVLLNHREHLENCYAREKSFPWEIVDTWDRKSLLAFVAGLIDTDGSVVRTENKAGNTLKIIFSSVSEKLIEVYSKATFKLFQIRPNITRVKRDRKKKDGEDSPVEYNACIGSTFNARRVLRELDSHLVSPSKRFRAEYADLNSWDFKDRIGVALGDSYMTQTYGIYVGNATNLYLLAEQGLVTHDSWTTPLDAR